MRKLVFGFVLGALIFGVAVAVAQPQAQSPIVNTGGSLSDRLARDCIMQPGPWTVIDCSNAVAATSAQLAAWSRYIVQCNDDSYFVVGDEATDVAVAATDGWLPFGAWLVEPTDGIGRYFSCLNKNFDSDCRYIGCL